MVGSHFICRYDDGVTSYNLESTESGRGGFSSQTDEFILKKHGLPAIAKSCGSDLRAVTAREMLGLFIGARARHFENTDRMVEAESDYLLARYLFPQNRKLYIAQNQTSVQCSISLFDPGEKGHPIELASWLRDVVRIAPWKRKSQASLENKELSNGSAVDAYFSQITVGG